ncbi:hypothetical protein IV471_11365 [Enterococcus gallinarum]|uniref:hypothetical protein n=1 Tax=Enterococcus gallinarum TaxID=1353 RepID=UPI001E28B293|nr:hypothetical protein [Enterococcus gallinarum]MCD5185881.1 hypothetical protein [Enterococcus gallinarum]
MSWITDLFIISKIKEDKQKKIREKNAKSTMLAYDIGKNHFMKEAELSKIKALEELEEKELNELTIKNSKEIVKLSISFFGNYHPRIEYYSERNNYFEVLLLMNEALFRLNEVSGNYFSKAIQKNSQIFSFFNEKNRLSADFITLLFNTIMNFDFPIEYKKNWLYDNEYDLWSMITENNQIREEYRNKTNIVNSIILELSVLESILQVEPVVQVLTRNFEKIFSFEINLNYPKNLLDDCEQNYNDILTRKLDSSFIFEPNNDMVISYSEYLNTIISDLMKRTPPLLEKWNKVINEYYSFREKMQDMMYTSGFDKNYVSQIINYFGNNFGFNPFELGIAKDNNNYKDIEKKELMSIKEKFNRKPDKLVYVDESKFFEPIFKFMENMQPLLEQEKLREKEEERLDNIMDERFKEKMDMYNSIIIKTEIKKLLVVLNEITK